MTTPVEILRKSQLAEMPSHDFFPNVKKTKTSAVLQAEKDFSFHIWTRTTTFYHAHSNYIEIFIVTVGKLVHHFNKQQSVLKTGDAFIVFPGQYHKHSPYKNYESQHINLTCRLPFWKDQCGIYFGEKASCEKQLVHLNAIQFETVLNFQKLILEAKSELSGTTSLKTLLSFLFGIFYTQDESPDMPEWLRDFVQKLNNINFGNDFKLSYIYSYSNYSQTTLCREFKKYTGKTLVSYVNDLKLNYCCNLLQNTSLPLWKIANSVGFYSQAHFTRLFKENTELRRFNIVKIKIFSDNTWFYLTATAARNLSKFTLYRRA